MRVAAASNVTAFLLECGDLRELDMWIERHRTAGGDTPRTVGRSLQNHFAYGDGLRGARLCTLPVCGLTPMR